MPQRYKLYDHSVKSLFTRLGVYSTTVYTTLAWIPFAIFFLILLAFSLSRLWWRTFYHMLAVHELSLVDTSTWGCWKM